MWNVTIAYKHYRQYTDQGTVTNITDNIWLKAQLQTLQTIYGSRQSYKHYRQYTAQGTVTNITDNIRLKAQLQTLQTIYMAQGTVTNITDNIRLKAHSQQEALVSDIER